MKNKTGKRKVDDLIKRASAYSATRSDRKSVFFPTARAYPDERELVMEAVKKHGGSIAKFYVDMAKNYLEKK